MTVLHDGRYAEELLDSAAGGVLSAQPPWPPPQVGDVADCERDFVRDPHGVSMAHVAERPAAVANRVWLFPTLDTPRAVGPH